MATVNLSEGLVAFNPICPNLESEPSTKNTLTSFLKKFAISPCPVCFIVNEGFVECLF